MNINVMSLHAECFLNDLIILNVRKTTDLLNRNRHLFFNRDCGKSIIIWIYIDGIKHVIFNDFNRIDAWSKFLFDLICKKLGCRTPCTAYDQNVDRCIDLFAAFQGKNEMQGEVTDFIFGYRGLKILSDYGASNSRKFKRKAVFFLNIVQYRIMNGKIIFHSVNKRNHMKN